MLYRNETLHRIENPHGGDVYTSDIRLDFSVSLNPLGIPESILAAMRESLQNVQQYPDPCCRDLVKAIAAGEQVPPSFVLCGNGAAELIYSYCEAVRSSCAVETAPTFSEYSLGLEKTGTHVERYPLKMENGFQTDAAFLDFLEKKSPDTVFLCNPNNPDGRLVPPPLLREILSLCRRRSIRLFVDECFLDLSDAGSGASLKPYLEEYKNLCILKAFTKNYAVAGIRLGYCLSADKELLPAMSAMVQPWNVSVPAQAAGIAAWKEISVIQKAREMIPAEREWLEKKLNEAGFLVIPSEANYLLFQGPCGLDRKLRERGIAIRSCSNFRGLSEGWYRIAVKLPEENRELIETLQKVIVSAGFV